MADKEVLGAWRNDSERGWISSSFTAVSAISSLRRSNPFINIRPRSMLKVKVIIRWATGGWGGEAVWIKHGQGWKYSLFYYPIVLWSKPISCLSYLFLIKLKILCIFLSRGKEFHFQKASFYVLLWNLSRLRWFNSLTKINRWPG